MQFLIIGNPASASGYTAAENVTITIGLAGGTPAPGRLKFVLEDDGAGSAINSPLQHQQPDPAGTTQARPGQPRSARRITTTHPLCGATPAILEGFSSAGGDPILFDSSGNRLSVPVLRNKPDFVGPDGVNNSIIGAPLPDYADPSYTYNMSIAGCSNNTKLPSFFGTSRCRAPRCRRGGLDVTSQPGPDADTDHQRDAGQRPCP